MSDALPGLEILDEGLRDLARGVESIAALLVAIGAPRLRGLGIPVPSEPPLPAAPEMRLYALLGSEDPDHGAHSRYNAWIRRLVSLERALELQESRRLAQK